MKNFPHQAPTPSEASFKETIHYFFNENERRNDESMKGLTTEQANHDPGHGAWNIGDLLKHQIDMIKLITNNLKPGSIRNIEVPDIGSTGSWNLEHIDASRKAHAARFFEVFNAMEPEDFMETHPADVYPPGWEEWPILMRMLRPLLDISTHIGQVNYARRQLDNPINS